MSSREIEEMSGIASPLGKQRGKNKSGHDATEHQQETEIIANCVKPKPPSQLSGQNINFIAKLIELRSMGYDYFLVAVCRHDLALFNSQRWSGIFNIIHRHRAALIQVSQFHSGIILCPLWRRKFRGKMKSGKLITKELMLRF